MSLGNASLANCSKTAKNGENESKDETLTTVLRIKKQPWTSEQGPSHICWTQTTAPVRIRIPAGQRKASQGKYRNIKKGREDKSPGVKSLLSSGNLSILVFACLHVAVYGFVYVFTCEASLFKACTVHAYLLIRAGPNWSRLISPNTQTNWMSASCLCCAAAMRDSRITLMALTTLNQQPFWMQTFDLSNFYFVTFSQF